MGTKPENRSKGLHTNKLIIAILVIAVMGDFVGLFFAYKYWRASGMNGWLRNNLNDSAKTISALTDKDEAGAKCRLIFIHHSVGQGILDEGHLRDSLNQLGIAVKGMTYGDTVGQFTDMCNWLPKFNDNMNSIFKFKNHPNVYYADDRENDIIMFKSCFPNSDIDADGSGQGDPLSTNKTLVNYKDVFEGIGREMRKYPDKLFIYWTFPPLVPAETSNENAKRVRRFNDWLINEYLPSYRADSGLDNFMIFDLFGFLTDENNVLKPEYRNKNPHDAHPNELSNKLAAGEFIEFFRPIYKKWLEGHGWPSPSGTNAE